MPNFKHTSESLVNMTLLMTPAHENFSGKIHGGYILNLMDQVAFACASKHSGCYCVTASVNKVDFLNPVEVGQLLHLRASINYTGRTSMVVGLRVETEDVRFGVTTHCNSSYFTMVAKDESGSSVPIPGLILDSEETIRRFARSMERIRDNSERTEHFSDSTFKIDLHLESLLNQNAEIRLKKD